MATDHQIRTATTVDTHVPARDRDRLTASDMITQPDDPLTPETRHRAALVCAGRVADRHELVRLLDMLGLTEEATT